jgi:hypothetical protein
MRRPKVASEPEALLDVLKKDTYRFKQNSGFTGFCRSRPADDLVETRNMRAVLKAQIKKIDRMCTLCDGARSISIGPAVRRLIECAEANFSTFTSRLAIPTSCS